MYSEHVSEGWEKHRVFTKLVFEREFENWVPDQDLIVLEWKKIDPVPMDTELRVGICFGAIGAEIVLIAIVMVYLTRKRKKERIGA
ncbi:MAG: hypothetical protein JXA22_05460 [Candidatus Thermoplasmatota archaeon]|nr:hypothetical protein [Candidatus Thermoplasmatota archaeon]